MNVLDLFCGAGGASAGYAQAGFEPLGVDIDPMWNYRWPFRQRDALTFLERIIETGFVNDFALIHASPPCQAYSRTKYTHDVEYPMLIEPLRELLVESGRPYIIENVPEAPLLNPVQLCGSMFGLITEDEDGTPLQLRRHRHFESNLDLPPGWCDHSDRKVAGVYGGGPTAGVRGTRGGYTPTQRIRKKLMGISWMNQTELSEAIPPAYTKYLGYHVKEQIMAGGWGTPKRKEPEPDESDV